MSEMNISIWGYGMPVIKLLPLLQDNCIYIKYIKADKQRDDYEEYCSQAESYGIPVYCDDYPNTPVDLIFVINYNKIIPECVLDNYLVVNYHVGLLPKWRGNCANGWGIINGYPYVGYTIHKVTPILDGGPIYYQFRYGYVDGETYYNARMIMNADLQEKLPSVLKSIKKKPSKFAMPNEGEFVYCAKFRPSDGVISNWNVSTNTLIRKFYVFAPPLGTGLKFGFKGKEYEIKALSRIQGFAKSEGVPGSIVYMQNGSMWVKTADTAISLDIIESEGQEIDVYKKFIIGQRL